MDADTQQKVEDIFASFDKDRDGVLNRVRASWTHKVTHVCEASLGTCRRTSALVYPQSLAGLGGALQKRTPDMLRVVKVWGVPAALSPGAPVRTCGR